MLSIDTDAASRLLQKLREFVRTRLEEDERALAAVLLAPGLAQAYAEEEVAGVPSTRWSERALPEALMAALRSGGHPLLDIVKGAAVDVTFGEETAPEGTAAEETGAEETGVPSGPGAEESHGPLPGGHSRHPHP